MWEGTGRVYEQTSVTMPAMMSCFLPVARTAARNSGLSHASTSPWRWMNGAVGCIWRDVSLVQSRFLDIMTVTYIDNLVRQSTIWSCFLLGLIQSTEKGGVPVSADVVKIVGRLKSFPRAAWARMELRNSTTE